MAKHHTPLGAQRAGLGSAQIETQGRSDLEAPHLGMMCQ